MRDRRTGIVDIVRDFFVAHQGLEDLFVRHRQGTLRFEDVASLVDDRDSSVLYRLKERSHSIFRRDGTETDAGVDREMLFDFALGALFHAAMGMREYFYQKEIYLPRVQRLRGRLDSGSNSILIDVERVLGAASARMDETFREIEALLAQTRQQLRLLIVDRHDDGLIARCLCEHRREFEAIFSDDLDALFAESYGEAIDGHMAAVRSYLQSACFVEALGLLDVVAEKAPERDEVRGLIAYAKGMCEFLAGHYEASIDQLVEWFTRYSVADDVASLGLARAALSRVPKLLNGESRDAVLRRARELAQQMDDLIASDQDPGASGAGRSLE